MKRAEILEAARVCVCGERQQDYGTPENNFETIGLLWGVYLRASHPELAKVMAINHINAKDVATMMGLLNSDCHRVQGGQLCGPCRLRSLCRRNRRR